MQNYTKYLILDTELTSFEKSNSLITLFLGIIKNNKLIDELDLKLIPDEGVFNVNPANMSINNIDIRNWHCEAITYKHARRLVGEFLRRYVFDKGNRIGDRLQVIGQAIGGDIETIQNHLISKESWDECVNREVLDTLQFAHILRCNGRLDLDSISLTNLAIHFGLDIKEIHTAREDSLLAYLVYCKLQELL